jgi:phage gp36-like protein
VDGTTPNAAVAQQIVDEAVAEADSYLARRYATPIDVAAAPELANLLTGLVLDLAEYCAWKSSPFVSDPPYRVHRLRAEALRWFEQVADGRLALPAAGPLPAPNAFDETPQYEAAQRHFTHEELDGL